MMMIPENELSRCINVIEEKGKGYFALNANTLIVTHVEYVRPEVNEGGQTQR
jgi:hypothetical protein